MTNSRCSSGAKFSWNDYLKSDAYDAFDKYLAEVAEYFKANLGISFQSITPMNESYTHY